MLKSYLATKLLMGSFLSIDQQIESLIYYPPIHASENDFACLQTPSTQLVLEKTNQNEIVPILIIKPNNTDDVPVDLKYVVFSHGNATDMLTGFAYGRYLANLCQVCVIFYDYIGYGLSRQFQPSEQKCYQSHELTLRYLTEKLGVNKSRIYLIGHSLGTGVVIDYVSKNDWSNAIGLISPYKTICQIKTESVFAMPFDKFTTIRKLGEISCPIKIFHGNADYVIDIAHGKEIYRRINNKTLAPVWFDNVGHRDILTHITREHYDEILRIAS